MKPLTIYNRAQVAIWRRLGLEPLNYLAIDERLWSYHHRIIARLDSLLHTDPTDPLPPTEQKT